MKTSPLLRPAAILALAACALVAQAQTVVNGGFETGDLSGWTPVYSAQGLLQVYGSSARTGTYCVFFGAAGPDNDSLSQSIRTVVGRAYTLSYYLKAIGVANGPFTATFGGASETTPSATSTPYALRTLDFTATSTSTPLVFAARSSMGVWALDDVSVSAQVVPEPASIAALGLGALAMLRRRRRA